jgi:UDP-N-acetylmuramoyl-L-alanyl-D-glutamate--2,6-diaminopimelate ligase
LYKVSVNAVFGNTNIDVKNIIFDSRKVLVNTVFVAQKGVSVDGHLYIDKAISLGAVAIICEDLPSDKQSGITYVQVKDSNVALAILASNFYENPSSKLALIGVTGTNGKTTVASLLYQLFRKAGYKVGLLSTVKILVDGVKFKATHTTPDSVTINNYLDKMIDAGVDYCFMEVSSHGIHQKKNRRLNI